MNTGNRNTGHRNTGDWNAGNMNAGDWNAGDWNTGHWNAGDWNAGDWNTGHRNTGNRNTGHRNAGDMNTGHRNAGNMNAGDWNAGDMNTGHRNAGNSNAGNVNVGHRNTGNRNTGNWNTGNRNVGFFNTETPTTIQVFDRPCTTKEWGNAEKPDFLFLHLTKWVSEVNMTDEEKAENPEHETTGGYLKTFTYHEAWANSFNDLTDTEKKQQIKLLEALPNFNYSKFVQISGLDYRKENIGLKQKIQSILNNENIVDELVKLVEKREGEEDE